MDTRSSTVTVVTAECDQFVPRQSDWNRVIDVGRGERTIDIPMTQPPSEVLAGSMLMPSTGGLPYSATYMVNWEKIDCESRCAGRKAQGLEKSAIFNLQPAILARARARPAGGNRVGGRNFQFSICNLQFGLGRVGAAQGTRPRAQGLRRWRVRDPRRSLSRFLRRIWTGSGRRRRVLVPLRRG